jgi:hypothetical protein
MNNPRMSTISEESRQINKLTISTLTIIRQLHGNGTLRY